MILWEKRIKRCRLLLVRNSILEEDVEVIVNPANELLSHGGGVAGLISSAGGPEIQRESLLKAPLPTGQACHTTAGTLPFRAVIHTVGPVWRGGQEGEAEKLSSAVRSALELAVRLGYVSISMPAISTGIFSYPLEAAVHIIVKTCLEFMDLTETELRIHLCEFSEKKAAEMRYICTRHFPA